MAKKKLNKKVAMIGSGFFLIVILAVIGIVLYLSRDPHKLILDGDTAAKAALQATDEEQRKELFNEAERNYKKSFVLAKTDELKIETLYRLSDIYLAKGEWREVLACWSQIVRIDPKDTKARYRRLKYFYIVAQATPGLVWQEVATQATEFIEIIEDPSASPELAMTNTSEWDIDKLKEKGEPTYRLGPYLHLIRGRATLQIAQLGMVTNKEETLRQAITDLEKVEQLEPTNTDVYLYLAQAAAFKGDIEASRGNLEASKKGQEEAIKILQKGIEATNGNLQAKINLLHMKHSFLLASIESDWQEQILLLEPEYKEIATNFSSSPEAISALANFYSDYRLGKTYLDKAIDAIEKAIQLDSNNIEYELSAANLYFRRFNIQRQNEDLNKALEITKKALSMPDVQETTGPKSVVARTYQVILNSMLAYSYIDQILGAKETIDESKGKQLLEEAQQAVRQIEQILGSGDDPQVIKWQGMIELAAAKLGKGDAMAATRKLYRTYTQLKASDNSDPHVSYRLGMAFFNSSESGAVGMFLVNALQNGIEATLPEARLDYAELLVKSGLWRRALPNIDYYERNYNATHRSRVLRIRSLIGLNEYAEAEQQLEQIPQEDPDYIRLRTVILQGKGRQIRRIIETKKEAPGTGTVLRGILSRKQEQDEVDQRSPQQLDEEMKNNLSAFIEYTGALLDNNPNSVDPVAVLGVCEDAIATGNLDQAALLLELFLKHNPNEPAAMFYKRLLAEPDPQNVPNERTLQLREEILSEVPDPVKRAMALGMFYQATEEPNKAAEQFKKLAGITADTEKLPADETSRHQAATLLFDIALKQKNWELADKISQMAQRENLDDCSGNFFIARIALAKKDYETALASAEKVLIQRPVFGYGYLLRSRVNNELGNESAALADIQTAASLNPDDKTIIRELAYQLYKRNQKLGNNVTSAQMTETRNALDWSLAINPRDLELMSFYAEYISESEPDRALALRQSLLQNSPSTQNALLLARLATRLALDSTNNQRKQTLFKMAFTALEQAKSYEPQNPAVLESYAEYYRQTGQTEKAEQLLSTTQNSSLLWRHYIREGRYDDAKKVLEKLHEDNPKDVDVLKGLIYLAEKNVDKENVEKYASELLLADETVDNHLLIIQTYLNTGLVKEAERKLASFQEKYPADDRGLMLGAWLFMKQGRLKEALELTNKELANDQSNATMWKLRGEINSMLTDYNQAIMDLKRSKTLLDSSATRVSLARAYLRTGRIEDAITELKSTINDPQAPLEARSLLEQIYLRFKQEELLNDFYAKTLEQLPESIYWHNRAAGFAALTGNNIKAEQLYELSLKKSIERGQENADALGGYLQALMINGKMDKLFEEAGKYIDSNLADVAYFRMAQGRLKLGDRATAIEYCRKSIERAGDEFDTVSLVLEKIYALLGEQDTEQICLQKVKANPDSLIANWTMFKLYQFKKDYNKALEYIDRCLKTTSSDQPIWLGQQTQKAEVLILAYYKTSDKNYLTAALEAFESVLSKTPNNTNILNNVAYILAENDQDIDKALEYAKRACETKGDNPEYLDTYAFVLYKKGEYAQAAQLGQAAIQQYEAQRMPIPLEVYEHLGQSYEQLGKVSQAIAAYEQALEAYGENISPSVKKKIDSAIERLQK